MVPGGKGDGSLVHSLENLGSDILFVDNEAEQIFVHPGVGGYEIAVMSALSPTVFDEPLHGLTLFIEINTRECHGMG